MMSECIITDVLCMKLESALPTLFQTQLFILRVRDFELQTLQLLQSLQTLQTLLIAS